MKFIPLIIAAFTIGLVGCSSNSSADSPVSVVEADSIAVDSLLADTIAKDSSWLVFPPFDQIDPNLDTGQIIGRSLDSLHQEIEMSLDLKEIPDSNSQIVGKWLVREKSQGSVVKKGGKQVFAIYHQDSIFSMKAINVLGRWWIKDSLLFQKYELPSKLNIDTTIIHVLNDSVLEVSEWNGDAKYLFKKVLK